MHIRNMPYWVGACAAITFTIPFLGRLGHLPASSFSAPFAIAACVFALFGRGSTRAKVKFALIPALIMGAYLILVAQSASAPQFEYVLHPRNWLRHADNYYPSKLMTLLVVFGPITLAAMACASTRDRNTMIAGFLSAALLSASLMLLRTLPYDHFLVRTTEREAWPFFDAYLVGFSTVSLGILCFFGAIASMATRRLWPLAALFCFMAFWAARKTELILIVAGILGMCIVYFWQGGWKRDTYKGWRFVPIGLAVIIAGLALHNDASLITWRFAYANAINRVNVISTVIGSGKAVVVTDKNLKNYTDVLKADDPASIDPTHTDSMTSGSRRTTTVPAVPANADFSVYTRSGPPWFVLLFGRGFEPRRVCRRPFRLSHAAMAASSRMA